MTLKGEGVFVQIKTSPSRGGSDKVAGGVVLAGGVVVFAGGVVMLLLGLQIPHPTSPKRGGDICVSP